MINEVKFLYGYHNRRNIESCNRLEFEILTLEVGSNINGENNTTYILYDNNLYKAIVSSDKETISLRNSVYQVEEKEKVLNNFKRELVQSNKITKVYNGFNFGDLSYLDKKNIVFNNKNRGQYIDPKIEIKGKKVVISIGNEVIGQVNDSRNLRLLETIKRNRDLVIVNENNISVNTFEKIERDMDDLFIIISENEKENYKKIERAIIQGCKFNDEYLLFICEDKKSTVEGEMRLILPENKSCKILLYENKLIIKEFSSRSMRWRGYTSLIIKSKENLKIQQSSNEENLLENCSEFNNINENKKYDNEFLKLINRYKEIEQEALEESQQKCKPLRYKSIEKDVFKIEDSQLELLENWIGEEGATISYKNEMAIGRISEVGEDFIKVDYKDDMVKSRIPKNKGGISISFIGDEVIQKRRDRAIKSLEGRISALECLTDILTNNYEFTNYSYKNLLEKYEIGRLADKQVKAIEGVLNTPDIFLIQGPPGTGKTTVIRKIVEKALAKKEHILISSFQNLAVDNVLDGFIDGKVIPYRFGDEENTLMNKICSEIVNDINISLKKNISLEEEEKLELTRISLEKMAGEIIRLNNFESLKNKMIEALTIIENYEGISSNYIKVEKSLEDLNLINRRSEAFNSDIIVKLMPEFFKQDLEVIESFEKVEKYLVNINKDLKDKTIKKLIEQVKELQDLDVIFDLDDKQYQKIKCCFFDEMKLIKGKSNDNESFDFLGMKFEISGILDGIVEEMPEYMEDIKYRAISDFHRRISGNPILIEEILKKYPDIRGTTCQKVASMKFVNASKGVNFDYVIIDEAARANPLDLLIPIIKGYKVILVGDHKQLPHMIENYVEGKFKEGEGYNEELFESYIKESLFGRLYRQLPNDRKIMLDTQYRMTKKIGDLVSELFYNNTLKTGTDIVNDTNMYSGESLVSINVIGKQKKQITGSYINKYECNEILGKLTELNKENKESLNIVSIGVISFYKSQVELLRRKINSLGLKNIDITVGTVDAFQGLEKDIILLSTVRTSGVGFTSNPNRLNVALSRAKKLVVIFGDLNNLSNDELFMKILKRFKREK